MSALDLPLINVRLRKELLQLQIWQMLKEFKDETGLSIVGCSIDTVSGQTVGQPTPDVYVTRVTLTVESI